MKLIAIVYSTAIHVYAPGGPAEILNFAIEWPNTKININT